MEFENQIELRPRFMENSTKTIEQILLQASEIKEAVKEDYRVKISDHHLFLFITLAKRKYYSPHLHLELIKDEEGNTKVKGLFGPDQTVWTFFMFLHFIIGGLFLIFMTMAYSHWSLNQSTTFDFMIMGLMVIFWFGLYVQARINRKKCQPQMHDLEALMQKIIA